MSNFNRLIAKKVELFNLKKALNEAEKEHESLILEVEKDHFGGMTKDDLINSYNGKTINLDGVIITYGKHGHRGTMDATYKLPDGIIINASASMFAESTLIIRYSIDYGSRKVDYQCSLPKKYELEQEIIIKAVKQALISDINSRLIEYVPGLIIGSFKEEEITKCRFVDENGKCLINDCSCSNISRSDKCLTRMQYSKLP